jgi:hypothetical protein
MTFRSQASTIADEAVLLPVAVDQSTETRHPKPKTPGRVPAAATAVLGLLVVFHGARLRGELVGSYDFDGDALDTAGVSAEDGLLLNGAQYIEFTRTGSGQAVDLTPDASGDSQVRIEQAGTELDLGSGRSFTFTFDLYVPDTASRGVVLSQLGSNTGEFGFEVRNESDPKAVTGLDTFLLEYRVGKVGQALPVVGVELSYNRWYQIGLTFDLAKQWNDTNGLDGQTGLDNIELFPGWLAVDAQRVDALPGGYVRGGDPVGGGTGHSHPIVAGGWAGETFMGDAFIDALRIYDEALWPLTVPEPSAGLLLTAAVAVFGCPGRRSRTARQTARRTR